MKLFIFALFFGSTVAVAQESLRQEMLDNLVAVNDVLALLPNLTAACVGCHAAYRTR